ncbi:MAG TPA: DUF1761 domain-containing protein [Cytophagales bacterium]|nr:DUF1761 domain-containing protein [Cytophagales bacterium]HAA20710.1 DUF1761 domain-containing protein [Cytophagales bacterium]HAP63755.1 DUF1761 domain-containing protein [Cytophagales bacterium]
MESINYLAVLVAGVASWMLGTLWYSKALFGKTWQSLLGFTDEYLQKGNMALIFGSSLVAMIVMAFGMAMFFGGTVTEISEGAMYGAMTGIFFVAMGIGINMLYQRKPLKLFFIDAGYQVIFLTMQGIILAAWQ